MEEKSKKSLSLFDLFSLGFGAIIGVGWSVTLNNMFINGGGPLPAILGFGLATLAFIPIALCFAELTPAMPVAGGVIAYADRAFGNKAGFAAGWFVAMSYIGLLPWEAIAINNILSFIFPTLRSGTLLYTLAGSDIYLNAVLVGIAVAFIVIIMNWRGIEAAAAFQTILTVVLIVGSALCVGFALTKADFANLQPVYQSMPGKNHTSFFTGFLTMFAMAPFYYSGFDTIPQGAEDAGNVDKRLMGKVIVLSLVSAGLFYITIFVSAGLAYPWTEFVGFDRPALSNLMVVLFPGALGKGLFWLSLTATLAGLFTTWNACYIAGSRLLLGMARLKLIPPFFATIHKKYGTPYGANIFCAVAMLAGPFLGIGVIDLLTLIGSTGFAIGWGLACLSAVRLRKTEPDMVRPYKLPGGVKTAWLGAIFCGIFLVNCIVPGLPGYMGTPGMIMLGLWSSLGVIFYLSTGKLRSGDGAKN